ncbi:DUF2793 domain-containing protein [Epibacterium ulvae]|uniref:peptidase G2 autoproteolytic cleavage domain-containing protein n=1 Tax=Epibacterium ulvae TaxID=1156985 RepID=UPI001BFC830E|nr:peptidase G2 autoproteolytic cleavage domain-containing protein [Epibacterium ulvae]MBT8154538.1 DUF2793 domain-containing protein [Epibacterium ulvae]
MPDLSPRLDLPFILPAQAQKHVTHNEALRRLDGLVQLVVQEIDAQVPPIAPTLGAAYALGAAPNAAWAGQAHRLAIWQGVESGGGWLFLAPHPGWHIWDQRDGQMRVWQDGAWMPLPCLATPRIGVATPADDTNRLAVAAPASLFTHAGAGHQVKLNKASPSDTASLLLQSNFSGRAEIGLTGTDDLSLKLSADGSTFADALVLSAGAAPRLRLSQPGTSEDLLLAEAAGTPQFRLTATGDGMAAGSWQSGGADYAEFFEWGDGNSEGADRRGISVVLEGDKIRTAQAGEIPIGVISSAPTLLGDADLGEWQGKYMRDAFGSRTGEISPDLDPNQVYIPRTERPEWAMVGLLGKLTLRAGQPTDPRWRRLQELDGGLERWLVR